MKNDFSLPGKGMVSVGLLHIIINKAIVYSLPGPLTTPAAPLTLACSKERGELLKLPIAVTKPNQPESTKKLIDNEK